MAKLRYQLSSLRSGPCLPSCEAPLLVACLHEASNVLMSRLPAGTCLNADGMILGHLLPKPSFDPARSATATGDVDNSAYNYDGNGIKTDSKKCDNQPKEV